MLYWGTGACLCKPPWSAGGRGCAVGKRRVPDRPEPGEPFARHADRYREGRRDLPGGLPRVYRGDDLFSTVTRQAGSLMRIVHLARSSAGVW